MTPDNILVPLHHLAHSRTGDKGDRSNISVIAYHPRTWEILLSQVTEQRVAELFAARRPSRVTRFVLPQLFAMNFVLDGVLDGGVNASLNLDTHGKTLSYLLLGLPLVIDAKLAQAVELGVLPVTTTGLHLAV